MTYLNERTGSGRRWRWWLGACLVVVLIVAAVAAFFLGASQSPVSPQPQSRHDPGAPSAGQVVPGTSHDGFAVAWQSVGGDPVPISATSGPRERSGGTARGYSHDAAGAVIAAIHLSVRTSSAAGPQSYEPTLATQTEGDPNGMLSALRRQRLGTPAPEERVQRWWWQIVSGDPQAGVVRVALLADTDQARRMGGYARIERTLTWRDGDWRLHVPVEPVQLAQDTAGFQLLGGPA